MPQVMFKAIHAVWTKLSIHSEVITGLMMEGGRAGHNGRHVELSTQLRCIALYSSFGFVLVMRRRLFEIKAARSDMAPG